MARRVLSTDQELIDAVKTAQRVFVFTGAGISKESGLPTFRDDDGLWKKYDPMTLATPEAFSRNPVAVWNMYRVRQKQIVDAQPNPAHTVLARMDGYYPEFLLTTQNVDDLHERAGTKRMVKIHGDAMQMRCLDCGKVTNTQDLEFPDEFDSDTLPTCDRCGGFCRPNIVWFGELVPPEPMTASVLAAAQCDLMLIIGTSGEVSGGYGFAECAFNNGATVIEINPVKGSLNRYATFWVAEPAGQAMQEIWNRVVE